MNDTDLTLALEPMKIRVARSQDIRTSVVENHQSREEIAELGITPETVAQMLRTDCRAWIADKEFKGEIKFVKRR